MQDTFGNGVDANLDVWQEDTGDPGTYEPFDDFFVPGTGQIDLPDGNYKIEISDDNDVLRTEWYNNQLDFDAATIVTVAGAAPVLSPIVLDPRPVITGVIRLGGVPVAGAFVDVLTANAVDTTDSLGRFAVPVDPGTHEILFGDSQERFAEEYWQDQYDQADATPVVVGGASVDLGSVNVGPGVNVSGTVTGPTGVPAARHRRHGLPGGRALRVGGDPDRLGRRVLRRRAAARHLQGGLRGPERRVLRGVLERHDVLAAATPLVTVTDQTVANINAGLAVNPAGGTEPPGTDASGVSATLPASRCPGSGWTPSPRRPTSTTRPWSTSTTPTARVATS